MYKEYGKEIRIGSKDYFMDGNNNDEFKEYLKKLGYFDKNLADDDFLQEVIKITGKNPYELMILNDFYKKINFQIDEQTDEKEQKMEILKIEYFENKNLV